MPEGKITKADIVSSLYEKTGMSRKEIGQMLDLFVLEIRSSLARRSVIELRGFGTFEVKVRKPRSNLRNPRTGEAVHVSAHGMVSFRPGRDLKQDVWNIDDPQTPGSPGQS